MKRLLVITIFTVAVFGTACSGPNIAQIRTEANRVGVRVNADQESLRSARAQYQADLGGMKSCGTKADAAVTGGVLFYCNVSKPAAANVIAGQAHLVTRDFAAAHHRLEQLPCRRSSAEEGRKRMTLP